MKVLIEEAEKEVFENLEDRANMEPQLSALSGLPHSPMTEQPSSGFPCSPALKPSWDTVMARKKRKLGF